MKKEYSKPLPVELVNPKKDDFFDSQTSKPLNEGILIALIFFELLFLYLTS